MGVILPLSLKCVLSYWGARYVSEALIMVKGIYTNWQNTLTVAECDVKTSLMICRFALAIAYSDQCDDLHRGETNHGVL